MNIYKNEISAIPDAPTVLIGAGAIAELPRLLLDIGIKSAFVFADKNTYSAAGRDVVDVLKSAGIITKEYVFSSDRVEPSESFVGLAMMSFDPSLDMIVAVGSGVINDISKIVANISGKKYAIVATAPSMDGYASATSSMSVGGLKTSLPSKCADIIIGDTDVLRNAPMKMLISGLGDMLAKYVALCEWRISEIINGEPVLYNVVDMVRTSLKKCVDNAPGLLLRDETATAAVFEGLVLCGLAMKLAGTSRPASGIEHYLSHIWDMRGEEFKTPTDLHGIQCAVGTYIAVTIYEHIKLCTPDRDRALSFVGSFNYAEWSEKLCDFLGRGAEAMIALEAKEGKYDQKKHRARLYHIIERWDDILAVINEELPTLTELTSLYDAVGMPKSMSEIGIDGGLLKMTFAAAKDIRDKYVLPRLAFDLGIIDDINF